MPRYKRIFVVDVAGTYERLGRCIEAAKAGTRVGSPVHRRQQQALVRELQAMQLNFGRELDKAATIGAAAAEKSMKAHFDATKSRSRGATGKTPHLRSRLTASRRPHYRGIATGTVGVANLDLLDRVRNEFSPGYGPYWRAQEFGTGTSEVPSQRGRIIHGFFVGTGGGGTPERPNAAYRGGGGPHPIFISSKSQSAVFSALGFSGGAGTRGGKGGLGTIQREIQGRHFIRDGANTARIEWLDAVRAAEGQAIRMAGALIGLTVADRTTFGLLGRRRLGR